MYRIRLAALSLGLVGLHLMAACSSDNDGEPSEFFGDAGAPGERPTGGKTGSTPTGGRTGTIPVGGTTQGSGGAGDAGAADAGDPGSPSGGAISGTGGGSVIGEGGVGTTFPPGVCSNGEDDDGDGFVDGMDTECSGPFDNDEDTFATGIPGDNRDPKWQDCFFDGNSGAGDDGCRYHTDCLYGIVDQDNASCQLTDHCRDFCQARTPNGCDCFGCCTVQDDEGNVADIFITGTCSTDNLEDTDACPRCTKSADCENTCGRCELCPGKTEADIPEDCEPPEVPPIEPPDPPDPEDPPPIDPPDDTPIEPPTYSCENGRVCSETIACPSGSYCQLGCCLVQVF